MTVDCCWYCTDRARQLARLLRVPRALAVGQLHLWAEWVRRRATVELTERDWRDVAATLDWPHETITLLREAFERLALVRRVARTDAPLWHIQAPLNVPLPLLETTDSPAPRRSRAKVTAPPPEFADFHAILSVWPDWRPTGPFWQWLRAQQAQHAIDLIGVAIDLTDWLRSHAKRRCTVRFVRNWLAKEYAKASTATPVVLEAPVTGQLPPRTLLVDGYVVTHPAYWDMRTRPLDEQWRQRVLDYAKAQGWQGGTL